MRGEILVGVERRRRWSEDQKLSILAEIGVHGATVTEVAQRHEITRQQIYVWRHALRRKRVLGDKDTAAFLPVELEKRAMVTSQSGGGPKERAVDIILTNGRCVRCEAAADDGAVMRAIRIAEAA